MASRPVLSLILITLLTSLLVMPAVNHPVSDVDARIRVAHWLWTHDMTSAPRYAPSDTDPEVWRWPGGLRGRDGTLHPWYGVGQSVLLLPADVVATAAGAVFKTFGGEDRRRLIVWYLVFPLLNAFGIAAAYLLLRALDVDQTGAILGALSLLFASTYLWHAQNIQENTQQFFFTATAFWSVLRWSRTEEPRWVTVAGALVGFNLLIRLTALADVAGVVTFALLLDRSRRRITWAVAARFMSPILGCLLLDRIYHWYRFGTFAGTYMGMLGTEMQRLNPRLPSSFPFNGAFADGFFGVFLSPAKSVFLFDPLLWLTLGLAVWQWRRLTPTHRAYLAAMSVMLIATAAGYAKYYNWDGEACWGNRFTTTPVFGLVLLAVPLALRARMSRAAIAGVVSVACCLQASSLIFPSWRELVQNGRGSERFGLLTGCRYSTSYFVIEQRLVSIWLWVTNGAPSVTCNGQAAGSSVLLWVLLPFKSLSIGARFVVRVLWLLGFGAIIAGVRSNVRRSPSS